MRYCVPKNGVDSFLQYSLQYSQMIIISMALVVTDLAIAVCVFFAYNTSHAANKKQGI